METPITSNTQHNKLFSPVQKSYMLQREKNWHMMPKGRKKIKTLSLAMSLPLILRHLQSASTELPLQVSHETNYSITEQSTKQNFISKILHNTKRNWQTMPQEEGKLRHHLKMELFYSLALSFGSLISAAIFRPSHYNNLAPFWFQQSKVLHQIYVGTGKENFFGFCVWTSSPQSIRGQYKWLQVSELQHKYDTIAAHHRTIRIIILMALKSDKSMKKSLSLLRKLTTVFILSSTRAKQSSSWRQGSVLPVLGYRGPNLAVWKSNKFSNLRTNILIIVENFPRRTGELYIENRQYKFLHW